MVAVCLNIISSNMTFSSLTFRSFIESCLDLGTWGTGSVEENCFEVGSAQGKIDWCGESQKLCLQLFKEDNHGRRDTSCLSIVSL